MLREGIARATRVVEQLLALARQDPAAPAEPKTRVDLSRLAESVADSQRASASARGLALEVDAATPLEIEGERESLRTLLDNLVDNAVRYTGEGGVTVRALREGANPVLEVEDTGPGVPEAERARIFDRFYRGEGAAPGGTGLGLAIVRRIAERHGALVQALAGAGGRGLRIRVVFPAIQPLSNP
jgi:signal transduction histidine kinase